MTTSQQPELEAQRAPHINRSIDNTALAAYMRCPREFYYGMVLNRRRAGLTKPALAYGTTWHSMLEAHYKTGGDHAAVVKAAIMSWQPHDNPEDHRTLERAVSEYDKYLTAWGKHDDEAKSWGKTVGYPDASLVECTTELWWPGALHPYTGKIDRIVENQGLFLVEDHKTTSALGPQFFRQFDPSSQMMGYAVLAEALTGIRIAGVRINAHAVLKTQSKFERQTILFSQDRLDDWKRNYNRWIAKLDDAMRRLQDTTVGLPGSPMQTEQDVVDAAFPYNFNACAGKYGMCQYVDVDTMPVKVRRRILDQDYQDQAWDPLNQPDGSDAE